MTAINLNDQNNAMDEDVPKKQVDGVERTSTPIASSSFYGEGSSTQLQKNTTPLTAPRKRKSTAGSSHTIYVPPASAPPPTYPSTWREPELVTDEEIPPIAPLDTGLTQDSPQQTWGNGGGTWSASAKTDWTSNYDPYLLNNSNDGKTLWPAIDSAFKKGVLIDNRNPLEEKNWWDPNWLDLKRPGPGLVPSLLADKLHNPEHSLFMISVTQPDFKNEPQTQLAASGSSSSTSSASPPAPPRSSSSLTPPPTSQEVLEAVPHPNAYYCRKHNGWVILAWKSSSIPPPLVDTFSLHNNHPLPDQERRKKTHSCIEEQPFGPSNKTHHFHFYEKAVDAAHLNPGFVRKRWEIVDETKKSRRKVVLNTDDASLTDVLLADQGEMKIPLEAAEEADASKATQDLLDLYMCCQCSFYIVVSDVIPGVIPVKYLEDFVNDKKRHPILGKTLEQSVVTALESLLSVIENRLWKGETRGLSVSGKAFSQKLGWNSTTQKMFSSLGFTVGPGPTPEAAISLFPPNVSPFTEEGKANRERLLRAWVETQAYLVDYQRRFPSYSKDYVPRRLYVKVESARETYQQAIGAHPDQLIRGNFPQILNDWRHLDEVWPSLGLTKSSFEKDLLQFAYLAQCRCDPSNTLEYYSQYSEIVSALRTIGDCPSELEDLLVEEQSQGRFTKNELSEAIKTLGFGVDNELKLEFDDDLDHGFIVSAWKDSLRRSWRDPNGSVKRRELNDAFKIVAESLRSRDLWRLWDDENTRGLSPEKAYSTLEVPMDVDEEMLITVYNMRVEDQPSQLDRMKSAMQFIADYTGSERLQRFLKTGSDPGVIIAPTRPDWPRGLNQLGNTCYLNSLLQYFYTIKDLREAIAPLAAANEKSIDDEKLKEDDLKHHRVGGRLVTRREVIRSRKFVGHLANLFYHLQWNDTPAITPSLELAKLALVTSKDEEEEDGERGGTDSSNSTDATLVEESVIHTSEPSKSSSPPPPSTTVLGKRARGLPTKSLSIDSSSHPHMNDDDDDLVVIPQAGSPTGEGTSEGASPMAISSPEKTPARDSDGDIEMVDSNEATTSESEQAKAPPLPPRRKHQASTSDMMFGKQHDVAECMDNCMFQIETALLELGELAGPDENKRSIVKRLFYGKIRQRLTSEVELSRSKASVHEREDFFSHLPVNVSEESFDLHDGLSGYFEDVVEFEGRKAKMQVDIVELPPILQIQLQRVQFNRETLQPYKSHTYVKFGETLSMDRFLHDAPPEKKARSAEIQAELNICRERIYSLTQGKHAPYADSLKHVSTFLAEQQIMPLPEVDAVLTDRIAKESQSIEDEINTSRARANQLKEQLEEVWRDEHRADYELTSVFVHRGSSPSFGHYFIYQRWLPDHPDEWFKYNDSDVTVVTKQEVLADTTGSTANPYLLVFARKGTDIIHTVQREDPFAAMQIS